MAGDPTPYPAGNIRVSATGRWVMRLRHGVFDLREITVVEDAESAALLVPAGASVAPLGADRPAAG